MREDFFSPTHLVQIEDQGENKGGIEEENIAAMRAKTHFCLKNSVPPEPTLKQYTNKMNKG